MNAIQTSALPPRHAGATAPFGPTALRTRTTAATLALALPLMAALPARAIPLDPLAFKSLGALVANAGEVRIDTDGAIPTLTAGGKTFAGVLAKQGAGLPDVAVFTFSGIGITGSASVVGSGARPLALLSQGDIAIDVTIDLSGGNGGSGAGAGLGGAFGGGGAGKGPGAGANPSLLRWGMNGGGFGGASGVPEFTGVRAGGAAYGDLLNALQAGSGGAAGIAPAKGSSDPLPAVHGGGGAGALEIGAVGQVVVGTILANGGNGAMAGVVTRGQEPEGTSGGGSGGAILLHGASVTGASLSARGGAAPFDISAHAVGQWGSGGGGGRILILEDRYLSGSPLIDGTVRGGTGPGNQDAWGGAGTYDLHPRLTEIGTSHILRPGADGTIAFGDGPTIHTHDILIRDSGGMITRFDYVTTGQVTMERRSDWTALGALDIAHPMEVGLAATVVATGPVHATAAITLDYGTLSSRGGFTFDSTLSGIGRVRGRVHGSAGSALRVTGGTLTLGDANVDDAIDWHGSMTIVSSADVNGALQLDSGSVVVLGRTSFQGSGARLATAHGAVLEAGTTMTADDKAVVAGDLRNDGRIEGPTIAGRFLTLDGQVSGTGSYGGQVHFSGSFSPGASPALVEAGDVTFDPDNVLIMELGGLARGDDYDAIDASLVTLGGTLQVVLLPWRGEHTGPAAGDIFDLLLASEIKGRFASMLLPLLDDDLSWQAGVVATKRGEVFRLAVTGIGDTPPVPEPGTWALLALGGLLLGWRGMRGRRRGG